MKRLLYSWIDVDFIVERKRAEGLWPRWLLGASAYHDGLVLRVVKGSEQSSIDALLGDWFGAAYVGGKGLLFEGPEEMNRSFPVDVEVSDGTYALPFPAQPTFRRVSLLPDTPTLDLPPAFAPNPPMVVAFYSFKGGVGRTTNLLAFLAAFSISNPESRALVVDADLEAPGITALVDADRLFSPGLFSFVDFLAVSHSDISRDFTGAIRIAAHAIRRQSLQIRTGERLSDHYFLPSHRDQSQFLRLDIRPEHLINSPESTWSIGRLLADLGRELSASLVLIDLRAGLSELAGPLLFDPRIRKVVVTTPSEQSIAGTEAVLRQLAKVAPPNERADLYDPAIVVTFLLPELFNSKEMEPTRFRLLSTYPDILTDPDPPLGRLRLTETAFSQELLYLPGFLAATSRVQTSGLAASMSGLVDEFVPRGSPRLLKNEVSLQSVRHGLALLAKRLEYAESGQGDRFLSILPLRSLAKQFSDNVPNAIVIGSKGAGKTYTCLQIVRSKIWSGFVGKTLGTSQPAEWGAIWPLLHSKNLESSARDLIVEARSKTFAEIGFHGAPPKSLQIEEAVIESLTHRQSDERWWRIRWFKLIADSLNIPVAAENEAAGSVINELRARGKRLVIVVDGLEDLFPEVEQSPVQQQALRALLQGVPAYLREIPNCPLGVLIFVRADIVSSAIPQNTGQFERLYEPFTLRWDKEEALRLSVWIARESGAPIDIGEGRALELITEDEARAALVPIWGRKLGPENSREARTPEWVIAALSDFKGQIQARDLVRFFRYAAEKSIGAPALDRVLTARAVRDAILPCSQQKVLEIRQEIKPLNAIFNTLQKSPERRIPFDAPGSGLSADQIQFLIQAGVLIEDQGEYFMPEIFRLGLGFQLASGARPRVLSFARRGGAIR